MLPLIKVVVNQNSEGYCNTLEDSLTPWAPELFGEISTWIFQHDNAPCHTSKFVHQWLTSDHENTLSWSERSPDVNVIDNVWVIINTVYYVF